ncbi:hypothetical protein I3843_08G142400 [Carya illinoinensis]|nr:hypothetical protein I3843_08G142400 [Carya illinoinensis]
MNYPLIRHVGRDSNSPHKNAIKCCEDLMNQSKHIDKLVEKQVSQAMENNRLQLKTLIESVRWLTFQACAFRGYDESSDSKNQVNFIKLIKLLTSYNDQVNGVVIENAPQNAKYTSPKIQKEILHIFANKVRNVIREEIRDAKFCILVDKARDESKREQMVIILRLLIKMVLLESDFFHIVHVKDTMALTLKNELCAILSKSNMRGEWNGLQALFLKNCPYAYYMHCCAHKLQLALVAASREAKHVHQFFVHLTSIINIIAGSSKRHDELQSAQAAEIESLIASKEIETGKWANQIGTLQRAGDTRWGSHFQSVCSLMRMFSAICSVINTISNEGSNYSQHIANAMSLVSTTKVLIQNLRDDGWESLLTNVKSFCEKYQIDIPDMNDRYTRARGKSHRQVDKSMEHHFMIDIFTATIDIQLQELNNRFNDHTIELLILSTALNPKGAYKSFKVDDICKLVEKFYPQDFTELHIRMKDEFLADHLLVYIEKEIAKNFTSEMIMDEFYSMKDCHRA